MSKIINGNQIGSPSRMRFSRKAGSQQHHRPDCAGFAIDRHPGTIEVAPELKNAKYDQQSENSPQRTQHAGGHAFENVRPLALGEQHDDCENRPRAQIDYCEYHDSHPPKGEGYAATRSCGRGYTIFVP